MRRLLMTIDVKRLPIMRVHTSAMPLNMPEAQATMIEPVVPPAVTGWLLFLCLLLTLVSPANTLYRLLTHTLPSLFGEHRARSIFLSSVYCVVSTALVVLSFIAGLKLWLVRAGAVRFAPALALDLPDREFRVFWFVGSHRKTPNVPQPRCHGVVSRRGADRIVCALVLLLGAL